MSTTQKKLVVRFLELKPLWRMVVVALGVVVDVVIVVVVVGTII